jgi:diguanylate cyclase (GGDEF)-like protein
LLLDRAGALWVGTRKGLLRRSAGDVRFQPVALPAPDGPAPTIRSLREDSAGRIWIGTKLFGAFVLDPGADRAHRVLAGPLDAAPLAESVVSILESGPGEVWLATEDSGIVRVDTRTWRTVREQSDATRTASLPSNQVATLFRDDGGTIWIGATSAPVSRVEPTQRQIQTFYGGTNRPDLLLDDRSISALLSQPDGRVWMGLGSGGIEIVDPASGRVGRIRTDPDHPDQGLPKAQVVTMARWSDGSVFLGTAAGLYRAGADGRTIERLQVPHEPRALDVRALLVRDGHLLVGGLDGLADLAVTSAGRLELVRRWDREIGDARVRTLVDGKGQGVWIGTPSGAALLDWAGGGITRLAIDPRNPDDLPGGYISSLLTDRRGRLWVATFGRGIQVERGRDAGGHPIFQRLTQSEGLPQNSVDALLADAHGNIWASTDGGLAQVHPDTLAIRAFRTEQGVGLEGFFTGIATVTAAGDLLFGGVDGLVVVHPDRVVAPVRAERVVPTEIRVGGRVLPPSPALYRDGVRIDPSDRSLAIEFAALDFDDPHARRYAYRLRGFDAGWVDTPASRRLAAYTNLPPGDYVLQLRSAGLGGPWSAPLEIPVHVQPAWYEYAAVRALAALLVLSLIAGLVHARMLLLRRRQAELESIVAERTAQLRKSQEYLASMAYMDALTQLPNRRMFNDQLRRMIAGSARGQGYFALLLIDLDGFKRVNDSFGHDAGDGVLVAVATRLRALIRETDLAARLGGDEFGVILAQTGDRAMVDTVCARIVKKLREPVVHAGHIIAVGASIGIAGVCDDIGTPEELYKAADAALYEAKRDGRNTWRWDPRTVTAVGA